MGLAITLSQARGRSRATVSFSPRVRSRATVSFSVPLPRARQLWTCLPLLIVACLLTAQIGLPSVSRAGAALHIPAIVSLQATGYLPSSLSASINSTFTSNALLPTERTCLGGVSSSNLIIAENSCPGTTAWRVDHPIGPENAIEAFTDSASVNIGESVHLYVSTTASSYTFQVFRLGWYQGTGARLMYSSPVIAGINQPPPLIDPVTGMISCTDWIDPATIAVPDAWVSGVYLVKLLSSAGYMRYTLFVVRDDAAHTPLLVQLGVMTYEAYNPWGGRSLYAFDSDDDNPTPMVSFDRPYGQNDGMGLLPQFEFPLIQWLERNGYDASYMADVDLVLHPQPLTQHRLIVVAGHDEYWTTLMRQTLTAVRDSGVSLAFFGANAIYWHARLQNSPLGPDRVVVCYRSAARDPLAQSQPSTATVEWREPPISDPENSLLGAMYAGIPQAPAPLVLAKGAQPFLTGTNLQVGSAMPNLVFGEIDTYVVNAGTPAGVTILAASPVQCNHDLCSHAGVMSNATLYTAQSGARVFDAGTFYWARGLDAECALSSTTTCGQVNAGFEQFTRNLIDYLLAA